MTASQFEEAPKMTNTQAIDELIASQHKGLVGPIPLHDRYER